ncbi:MAG: hypothetical protein ABW098_06975 [Candidatus Thiodiazotropha sp.]
MSDEYWKAHNQGRNNNARPVGGGTASWVGYNQGQRERQSQQTSTYSQPSFSHIPNNSQSNLNNPTYIPKGDTGNQHHFDGDFSGVVVIIFVGLCVWGAIEVASYFDSDYLTSIGIGTGIVSFIVGSLLSDLLYKIFRVLLALTLVTAIAAGVYYFYFDDADVDSTVKTPTEPPLPKTRSEVGAFAKKIIAKDMAKLQKLNANSTPIINRNDKSLTDPTYNCRLCKSLIEKGKDLEGKVYKTGSTGKIKRIFEYCLTEHALKSCRSIHSISWKR